MPACNEDFPWLPYYENYDYFEKIILTHSKVKALIPTTKVGMYRLELRDGRVLSIFICDCYSFGVAEYHECVEELGKLDAIIINSIWCGYTEEAKIYCRNNGIGLFSIKEFMGAINLQKFWMYLTEWQKNKY